MSSTMENGELEVTEYERERLERIKRNRDMLANLQVPDIATTLKSPKKARAPSSKGKEKVDIVLPRRETRLSTRMKSPAKIVDWSSNESDSEASSESEDVPLSKSFAKWKTMRKQQRKKKGSSAGEEISDDEGLRKKKDDDEYEPSGASESDQDDEQADEPEDDEPLRLSEMKQRRGTNGRSSGKKAESGKYSFRLKPLKSSPSETKNGSEEGDRDADDTDLEQAIWLSMQQEGSLKSPSAKGAGASKQRKRKGGRDLKFTPSEVDSHFVSIAGSDMGVISLKLLEYAAISHDFIWSEEELQDMIDVFDENDDGFLTLSEFRAMAARCKLIEAT